MSITPRAIQDLLDELATSKQSRLRAWNVLQRLRLVLSELGNVALPPPAQRLRRHSTRREKSWNMPLRNVSGPGPWIESITHVKAGDEEELELRLNSNYEK